MMVNLPKWVNLNCTTLSYFLCKVHTNGYLKKIAISLLLCRQGPSNSTNQIHLLWRNVGFDTLRVNFNLLKI